VKCNSDKFDTKRLRRGLDRLEVLAGMGLRIVNQRGARNAGRDLLQRSQPFSPDRRLERNETRDVAFRPRQARNKAAADRI
jgi:hypothetical protein